MIGEMAIAIALPGFNALEHPVTPTFLFRNRFIYNYLHIVQNEQKINVGRQKKFTISVRETSNPAILRLQGA